MKSVFYNLSNPSISGRERVKRKPQNGSLKFILAVIGIPNLLLFLLIGTLVIYFTSYSVENPYEVVNGDAIDNILNDSLEMYGMDFTKAMAAYLVENRTFDDYNRVKLSDYRDVDYLEKLLEDETVLEYKEYFDNIYGEIISESNNKIIYYNWYFPIAQNNKSSKAEYKYNYTNDYGDARSYGGNRTHKGIDLMCDEGTPIIAVESGTVETIGWDNLGGWRIGIKSDDGERFWYYAHMRKENPYAEGIVRGTEIKGGQVIGYVGSTGYSENITDNTMPKDSNGNAVDGKFESHLHLGYINYEEDSEYFNPFSILNVLEKNTVTVEAGSNGELVAIEKTVEERYIYISSVFSSGKIGQLSEKYESNGSPGAIGNNYGDFGGKSYGAFQFSSNMGSLASFLSWLKTADKEIYYELHEAYIKDGYRYSTNFDAAWGTISSEDASNFYNLQYTYIKNNYFDPVVIHFRQSGQIDFTERSDALQNVVWSTSVQHGTYGAINIINTVDLSKDDATIIKAIYNERRKVNKYFSSSSQAIKNSVYNRFIREERDALSMLENEENEEDDDEENDSIDEQDEDSDLDNEVGN
jgi:murein DD-endopeptidase MepM/ murein hydrolase activator NlpD